MQCFDYSCIGLSSNTVLLFILDNGQTNLGRNPVNSNGHIIAALCFMCFMPIPILNNYFNPVPNSMKTSLQPVWKGRNLLSTDSSNLGGSPLIPDVRN